MNRAVYAQQKNSSEESGNIKKKQTHFDIFE